MTSIIPFWREKALTDLSDNGFCDTKVLEFKSIQGYSSAISSLLLATYTTDTCETGIQSYTIENWTSHTELPWWHPFLYSTLESSSRGRGRLQAHVSKANADEGFPSI